MSEWSTVIDSTRNELALADVGILAAWTPDWDCIVVGGGAVGLSAALVLGRARQRTLVVYAGVLDRGSRGVERALLLRVWSDDVTPFTNGPAALEAAERERLDAAGVTIEVRGVIELRGPATRLQAIALADRTERARHGLLVRRPSARGLRVGSSCAGEFIVRLPQLWGSTRNFGQFNPRGLCSH